MSKPQANFSITGTDDPTVTSTEGELGLLYFKSSAPLGIYRKLDDGNTTNWLLLTAAASNVLRFFSNPTHGGAAAEMMTVTGLLGTDTIIAVTQSHQGTGNLPLLGWDSQGDDTITCHWVGDPTLNAVVEVAVLRAVS